MRILKAIVGCGISMLALIGCSDSKEISGIEIGNPAIAEESSDSDLISSSSLSSSSSSSSNSSSSDVAPEPQVVLALTADFSVDYDDVVHAPSLAKKAAKDEPVLLDSFAMTLSEVRTYSSYYEAVTIDPTEGLPVWPAENSPDTSILISFTEGSMVDDAFSNINLDDGGLLKEIGVVMIPEGVNYAMKGRILVDGEYVPFVYSLSAFQKATLRYHFSQVDWVSDSLVNLSVSFYVRYFVNNLDLASANVSDDGIIRFNNAENTALWNQLNQRFLPSFRPLRFNYVNAQGNELEDFVSDIWENVVGEMSDNTIENGDFSDSLNNWIFVNQFSGKATATILKEKNDKHTLKVDVTDGGNWSYSVQLIQEDVALVKNKKYKCVFTIWSNVEGQITARIGTYDDYETVGFQKHVDVKTTGQSVEIEFTPSESTPFARFELNLGNEERIFYIKDVQIYRIEKMD